jgi:hypothetical protein
VQSFGRLAKAPLACALCATVLACGTSNNGSAGNGSGSGSGGSSGSSGGSGSGSSSGSVTGADCPAGVIGHCDSSVSYTPPVPGYTLALAEEFNTAIPDIDQDPNWAWSDGGLNEGDVRFVKNRIAIPGDGNMYITAAMPSTLPGITDATPPAMSYAENASLASKPWLSGELRTKYNNYRYGWYEARFKPPPATTTSPTSVAANYISTLFVFRTPRLLDWREIDVELTADGANSPGLMGLGTNMYYRDNNGSNGYDSNYAQVANVAFPSGASSPADTTDFHVYAFNWTPTYVEWFVDGKSARKAMPTAMVPIPDKATKLIMNLWLFAGTGFGGGNDSMDMGALTATYDYVRFYKSNAETTYPCSPTPSCVQAADIIESKNNPDDGVPDNPAM